jgi:hypothetical protein
MGFFRRGPEDHGPGPREDEPGLGPEDAALLDRMAAWLAERRLATPAILFLESVKPLNFVGSQMMFFFEPVVRAVIEGGSYSRFASIMEERENVEEFLRRIEAADAAQRDKERAEKAAKRGSGKDKSD